MDLSAYIPTIEEISAEAIQSERLRLARFYNGFSDLDTRPNTPFGDLYLTPAAIDAASRKIQMERFLSDLDPARLQAGTIYSCDVATRLLQSLGVIPTASKPASGVVRLTFTASGTYELDRGLVFSFASNDTTLFQLKLVNPGPLIISPLEVAAVGPTNAIPLVRIGPDLWAADAYVEGVMAQQVTSGTKATVSEDITCLAAATALVDFDTGIPGDSLVELAKRTALQVHAASLSTRNGTRRYLMDTFPALTTVSPVLSGDYEMLRDAVNALGFYRGNMDVFVRSEHVRASTISVQLTHIAVQDDETVDSFVGTVQFPDIPLRILSIKAAANPEVDLGVRGEDVTLYGYSSDSEIPGLTAGFSRFENFELVVRMPRGTGAEALLTTTVDSATGDVTAWFNIEYESDVMVALVDSHVTGDEVAPVGVRLLCRGFNLCMLDSLTVEYRRRKGIIFDAEKARTEIYAHLMSRGGPEMPFSDAEIADSMFYSGASQTGEILCSGQVSWTVADKYLLDPVTLPSESIATAVLEALDPHQIFLSSSADFTDIEWKDATAEEEPILYAAIGSRNFAFWIDKASITFREK